MSFFVFTGAISDADSFAGRPTPVSLGVSHMDVEDEPTDLNTDDIVSVAASAAAGGAATKSQVSKSLTTHQNSHVNGTMRHVVDCAGQVARLSSLAYAHTYMEACYKLSGKYLKLYSASTDSRSAWLHGLFAVEFDAFFSTWGYPAPCLDPPCDLM